MAVNLDIEGSIAGLEANAKKAKDLLLGLADANDDLGEASKQAAGVSAASADRMAAGTKDVNAQLNNQQKLLGDLNAYLKRLSVGQAKATDVKTWKKYNKEIASTKATINAVTKSTQTGMRGVAASVGTAGKAFAAIGGTIAAAFGPLLLAGTAVEAVKRVIGIVSEYEQSARDLSAITGASGQALEFLKQQAVELGVETTVGANQAVEAYKLIASAKPELLGNAEALAAVTKEAVALSEASGLELPTAATALTDALNQFSAPAEQAGRFINALAAGSKEGSAEIPQVVEALKAFGVQAASANVSIEESVGLIELLAEKGLKGAEAGTKIRNVFTKLSATDVLPKDAVARLEAAGVNVDVLSDKSVSLQTRLTELSKIQGDANALTSLFGAENQVAGQIILQNVDRYQELATAVEGTNTAYEQAETRTAGLKGETARLVNTIQAVIQGNGSSLEQFLALLVKVTRLGVLFFFDAIERVKPGVVALFSAVGDLFKVFSFLNPATEEAGRGSAAWGAAVDVVTNNVRLLVSIVTGLVKFLTFTYGIFVDLLKVIPGVNGLFSKLGGFIASFALSFASLPAIVDGSVAAVETFAKGVKDRIQDLGSGVGAVLKEAFNIGKLIREGRGDLDAALDGLKATFGDIGSDAAAAFTEAYNKSIALVKVEAPETDEPVTPDPTGGGGGTGGATGGAAAGADAAKKAEDLAKARQKAEIDALKDGTEKQLAIEQARFEDLKKQLEKFNIDTLEATYQHELNKFTIKQAALEQEADLLNLTGVDRINFFKDQANAELDLLESTIRSSQAGELLEGQQAQLALLRRKANESYLDDIKAFQDEEAAAAEAHEIALLELKAGEFETLKEFEKFKGEETLKIRLKFAEQQLAIIEGVSGAESDAALKLKGVINDIKGELEGLADSSGGGVPETFLDLAELLGIDDETAKGIQDAAQAAIDIFGQITDARLEAAEAALDAADKEVEASQKSIDAKQAELDREIDLQNQGFANDVAGRQAELASLKNVEAQKLAERKKAQAELAKIQKQQLIGETISQGANLITAAAKVFNSVAAIPFVGIPLAIGLVASMFGAFASAKSKAFKATKAERGIFGVVRGRLHADGGEHLSDIETQDGEAYSVLNREATSQYGGILERFTKAANKGDRRTLGILVDDLVKSGGVSVSSFKDGGPNALPIINVGGSDIPIAELKTNNKLLAEILEMKKAEAKRPRTDNVGGKFVTRKGNRTRITKS